LSTQSVLFDDRLEPQCHGHLVVASTIDDLCGERQPRERRMIGMGRLKPGQRSQGCQAARVAGAPVIEANGRNTAKCGTGRTPAAIAYGVGGKLGLCRESLGLACGVNADGFPMLQAAGPSIAALSLT
jgi:hypothetical protein